MTIVNSNEFVTNREKYFDLAVNEDVCIKNGENMFHLKFYPVCEPEGKAQVLSEPDADYYRAISANEFRKQLISVLDNVDKKYAKKCE